MLNSRPQSFTSRISKKIVGTKDWILSIIENGNIVVETLDENKKYQVFFSDNYEPWLARNMGTVIFKEGKFFECTCNENILSDLSDDAEFLLKNSIMPSVAQQLLQILNERQDSDHRNIFDISSSINKDLILQEQDFEFCPVNLEIEYQTSTETQWMFIRWAKYNSQSSLPEDFGAFICSAPDEDSALKGFAQSKKMEHIEVVEDEFHLSSKFTETYFIVTEIGILDGLKHLEIGTISKNN